MDVQKDLVLEVDKENKLHIGYRKQGIVRKIV